MLCACAPSVTGLVQRSAGAHVHSSSDDLVANGSHTTQKTLLRRGNNFYTVDRPSAEVVMAEIQDELFDLEKAPDDFQTFDGATVEDGIRGVEHTEREFEEIPQDYRPGNVPVSRGEDVCGSLPKTTLENTNRPRSRQFRNQATDMAALLYKSKVSGQPKKVEISHDPPSEPAEARLTYRDEYNILHEVTVTDIPQPPIGQFHSGHGVRPTILRAISEADSRRTSKYLSGDFASPVYSPATPGSRPDQSPLSEVDYPRMVSSSSQTDFFEPHSLSPIHSHSSSPGGKRLCDSIRPSLSSRSTSTQTDEQTLSSFASRTSSPAGYSDARLMSPLVLSRAVSAHTQDSQLLPSPLVASPVVVSPGAAPPRILPEETSPETPLAPQREFCTATTQVDDSDALPLSHKLLYGRSSSGSGLERVLSPLVKSQHSSTQTIETDLPSASPLSLASPVHSPVASSSGSSFVGLASVSSMNLSAETQTDEIESSLASPLSSRRSSSTQTIGFLGLDSKRRLGI